MTEYDQQAEQDAFLSWKPELGFRETVRADMQANAGNPKGKVIVFLFRLSSYLRRGPKTLYYLSIPYIIWYRLYVEWSLGVELPPLTRVGAGLTVHHGQGLVVNNRAIIGKNCTLRHGVTIGNKTDTDIYGCPVIGDGVNIGAGAIILGRIKIGDGATIGAASVITKDVEERATMVGNPGVKL
ncbi:serine acetyltransferase [Verrucomicrobiaceae bacterium R5-34]|nr:serine acetyltransferase [Verrucomicrobiaceae bacterium R5-34]